MTRIGKIACGVCISLFIFSPAAFGQTSSDQSKIRVKSAEVVVPVTVVNAQGEPILDLAQRDFQAFDNGAEQTIDHWEMGGGPLAVALVIETSSHIQMMAPVVHGMGIIFTETVMAMNGEAAIITYDSTVDVRQPFTTDHDAIQRAIANVDFEAPEMRLYDAMDAAVKLLAAQPANFRRVMLVVGESQDDSLDTKLGMVLRKAQLANIVTYSVGPSSTTADLRYGKGEAPTVHLPGRLPDLTTQSASGGLAGWPAIDLLTPAVWLVMRGTNAIKNHQLEVAAAATGGIHYRALHDSTIRSAVDKIGGELHTQYVLSYAPSPEPAAGFHEIKVTVDRENVKIRARPGYFVASPQEAATQER
jgi:VWFA-related protein